VAAGKYCSENPVYHVFLPDDALRNLTLEPSDGTDQAFQLLDVLGRTGSQ
jgi:hypothetical protein